MRSPPALRELNVDADRRAQLILSIMRIPLLILWNKYTRNSVHGKHYNSYFIHAIIIRSTLYSTFYSTLHSIVQSYERNIRLQTDDIENHVRQ